MIGVSIPEFFLGVLLLLVFSIGLGGLLPSSGWVYLPGTCPTHGLRRERLGQHAARADARAGPRGGAGRPPDAAPAGQHAGGHPHRVRHDRPRQGPWRAADRVQARAEERPHPDRHRDGPAGRLPHRGRHRRGNAVRHAGPRHLRHRCHHRPRLPAGAGIRPHHGLRLRRDQPARRSDVHVPGSADPVRAEGRRVANGGEAVGMQERTIAEITSRGRPADHRRPAGAHGARRLAVWRGRPAAPPQHDSARSAGPSSPCCSSSRSSRTCSPPRARSPATRPQTSSGRAGTIRSGRISSGATC